MKETVEHQSEPEKIESCCIVNPSELQSSERKIWLKSVIAYLKYISDSTNHMAEVASQVQAHPNDKDPKRFETILRTRAQSIAELRKLVPFFEIKINDPIALDTAKELSSMADEAEEAQNYKTSSEKLSLILGKWFDEAGNRNLEDKRNDLEKLIDELEDQYGQRV